MPAPSRLSLRSAALIAGLSVLLMVFAAPFAELYAFPKLVVSGNAVETTHRLLEHRGLFVGAVMGYALTFLCDIVAAWALFVLLRPVDEDLSRLAAWLRLAYGLLALAAMFHLVDVVKLLNAPETLAQLSPEALNAQILAPLKAFKSHWYFSLLFFALHLLLLGALVWRAAYIPKAFGPLLILAGLGYLLSTLRPFLYPQVRTDFAQFTFYGELAFMVWLLGWGWRLREPQGA